MKRVVLFGAGASYGCGGVAPFAPPLGSELIGALASGFPRWKALAPDLRQVFDGRFEDGMQRLREQHGLDLFPLLREMACFFSQFTIRERAKNLYARLLERYAQRGLHREVLLSTLNYDLLIEEAALARFKAVRYKSVPDGEDSVCVHKLHGSCNWRVPQQVFDFPGTVQVSDAILKVNIEPIPRESVCAIYMGGSTALPPAMSLYARGKPAHIAPNWIDEVQRLWTEAVEGAEMVVVVGVLPNAEDTHVWGPLGRLKGELVYVGGRAEFEEWRRAHRPKGASRFLGKRWASVEDDVTRLVCGE